MIMIMTMMETWCVPLKPKALRFESVEVPAELRYIPECIPALVESLCFFLADNGCLAKGIFQPVYIAKFVKAGQ